MACPEGGSRNSKCGNCWEVSRSWEWVVHSESNAGMASHPSEDKGPAVSQHRVSHRAHTAQGSPGMCLPGRGWESNEWDERLLVPDYFIFLHGMPVLIGRQPDRELEAVGSQHNPLAKVLLTEHRVSRVKGMEKHQPGKNISPGYLPGLFLSSPGPGSSQRDRFCSNKRDYYGTCDHLIQAIKRCLLRSDLNHQS